jgi:hypothetical protein
MKKITILFAAAALCGALAFDAQANGDTSAPPPSFGAGYASPQYWIDGAKVKQSLSVSGCKTLNLPKKGTTLTTGNLTLFDDNSFVLYQDWSTVPDGQVAAITGQWTELLPAPKSSKTFYLSINTASMTTLLDDIQAVGLANCITTKPLMTKLDILDSSVLVTKNTIVVKIKNNIATGSLLVKGSEVSNPKGTTDVVGKLQMKLTMTGFFNAAP